MRQEVNRRDWHVFLSEFGKTAQLEALRNCRKELK